MAPARSRQANEKAEQVGLKRIASVPGQNPGALPTKTEQTWPLSATIKKLHQRYENGVVLVETRDMVTFAVPEVEPVLTDTLIIDSLKPGV